MARIAFCQDTLIEYLGYMFMSSVLKEAGHTVDVFCCTGTNDEKFADEVAAFQPDIVGFAVFVPGREWTIRMGKMVKERSGAVTVYGNVDAMLNPGILIEAGADIICLWEGEEIMCELAACIDEGRSYSHIKGLWLNTPDGVVKNEMPDHLLDLDALPFHDRGLYDKYAFFRHSKYLRLLNGRGCPNRCSFCFNRNVREHFGGVRYIRKRTPELAIQEIEHHVRNRKRLKQIYFVDEVFWVTNSWMREFLKRYKERVRVPFMANFRWGPIKEEDIQLMAEAGAVWMICAIESGDEHQRRTLLDKDVSDDHILQIAGWMHKYGINFGVNYFFGLPGDTVEDHVARLDLLWKINPTYLWTTYFEPYPGLVLTERPETQALLPERKEFAPLSHHEMYLDLPDKDRLMRLKKIFHYCVRCRALSPLLIWLTKFRIPVLFDLLFMSHYAWNVFRYHRVSFVQLLQHIKVFMVRPILQKIRPPANPPHTRALQPKGPKIR